MLDKVGFMGNLVGLFYSGIDWRDIEQLRYCEHAFKNLTLHCIEQSWPELLDLIQFDDSKIQMMLKRFYRDSFGVAHFQRRMIEICPDEKMRMQIFQELRRLSIRINSGKPRKTRIAASFSLWMATFRPIFLKRTPSKNTPFWHLDAVINFYIASSFLRLFGDIEIGTEGHDRQTRLRRIYYDFTVRDLNLSSLEMLYCSIFRPDASLQEESESTDSVIEGVRPV